MQSGAFVKQNVYEDKSLCNKNAWNCIREMLQLDFLFQENEMLKNNEKKCDMFLIALVRKDNDLRGNTWNISHVIHVVVGEWKSERTKKYLLKWFMLLFVYYHKIYLAYNWISNCILMENW